MPGFSLSRPERFHWRIELADWMAIGIGFWEGKPQLAYINEWFDEPIRVFHFGPLYFELPAGG